MNKRIVEIADQANAITNDIIIFGGENYVGLRDEQFAHLIIQECCIALNPMLRDMVSRSQCVELIKQHFGVE